MKSGNTPIKPFVFYSSSGCLLPLLILFNLFFGWMFLKAKHWLIAEGALILFFIINGYVVTRKVFSGGRKRRDAIDVEGEVVEEKQRLKGQPQS